MDARARIQLNCTKANIWIRFELIVPLFCSSVAKNIQTRKKGSFFEMTKVSSKNFHIFSSEKKKQRLVVYVPALAPALSQ